MHYAQDKSCYRLTSLNKKALRPAYFPGAGGLCITSPIEYKTAHKNLLFRCKASDNRSAAAACSAALSTLHLLRFLFPPGETLQRNANG